MILYSIIEPLLPLAARYQDETGSVIDTHNWMEGVAVLHVPTITGLPTSLNVKIQGSADGINFGDFKPSLAFTEVTATPVTECIAIENCGFWLRAVATVVGGTIRKSYTFSVSFVGKAAE